MIAVPGALAVLNAWVEKHPTYSYTATAVELQADGTPETAVIRIAYDTATNVETAHIISGRMAGADVRYAGGDTADVRGPGIAHFISVRLPLRDPRLLSPRGNDARVAIFSNVARCYDADAAHLRVSESGDVLVIDDDNPSCTAGYGPLPVTRDRLTLDADGEPLERDRYDGTALVEKWTITDLK
jgi:hypothetical protein